MVIDPKLSQYQTMMTEDWLIKLQPFLLSEDWNKIKQSINAELQLRKRLTPSTNDIFNAFKYTSFESTRVVIIGQNPYPQEGIATGIAFESKTSRLPESLDYIYNAIEEDVYGGFDLKMDKSADLKFLCEQGVLLLNTSLTTQVGVTDVNKVWIPFTAKVMELLNVNHSGLIFCFWGREAQSYMNLIDGNKHTKLSCLHPVSGWHNGGVWKCNHFSKVNEILLGINGDTIAWDKYYYELSKSEVPF